VLYANSGNKEYTASLKSKMSNWTDIVVKDIVIENGECEVGLYSDAIANSYVRIDDLYLTRNYDGTVIDGKLNKNIPVTNTLTLKNAQGETVTELGSGEVYAEAAYINKDSKNKELTLYMVLYDKDGILQSVRVKNETATPNNNGTIRTENMNISDNSEAVYVKLFLWEDGMKPLCGAVTIN
jgi:hypothetical protein